MGTTVAVRQRTREAPGMLKSGEETYDEIITLRWANPSNRPGCAEFDPRSRSDEFEPAADMPAESRARRARGLGCAIALDPSSQGSGGVLPTAAHRSVHP